MFLSKSLNSQQVLWFWVDFGSRSLDRSSFAWDLLIKPPLVVERLQRLIDSYQINSGSRGGGRSGGNYSQLLTSLRSLCQPDEHFWQNGKCRRNEFPCREEVGPKSGSDMHGRRSCMIRSVYRKDNRVFDVVSASRFASHQIFKQINFQHFNGHANT